MKLLGKAICEQNCLKALGLTEIEIKIIMFILYTSIFRELKHITNILYTFFLILKICKYSFIILEKK